MPEITLTDLSRSLASLEKKNRRMTWLLAVFAAMALGSIVWMTAAGKGAAEKPGLGRDGILRVRGISVVDERGTERVYIGAPVREPLILGKRFPRGGRLNGILLFDEDGTERSGYCTSDGYPNVLFTLDSIGTQHVLFMSEPQGDTAFWIWNGGNSYKVTVGEEESGLKITQAGKMIMEVPPAPAASSGGKGQSR